MRNDTSFKNQRIAYNTIEFLFRILSTVFPRFFYECNIVLWVYIKCMTGNTFLYNLILLLWIYTCKCTCVELNVLNSDVAMLRTVCLSLTNITPYKKN